MRNIHRDDDRSFSELHQGDKERAKSWEETRSTWLSCNTSDYILNTSKGDIYLWFMYQCPSSIMSLYFLFFFFLHFYNDFLLKSSICHFESFLETKYWHIVSLVPFWSMPYMMEQLLSKLSGLVWYLLLVESCMSFAGGTRFTSVLTQ